MSNMEETYSSDSSDEDDAFAAIVSKSMQGLAEAAVDVKKSKEAAVLAAELKKKNDEKSKAGKLKSIDGAPIVKKQFVREESKQAKPAVILEPDVSDDEDEKPLQAIVKQKKVVKPADKSVKVVEKPA